MTSAKAKANRANARASTGPKTVRGKAHAARNARRHGLSLPVASNAIWSAQIESLAQEIVGVTTDNESLEHARQIASAQIELNRIRQVRHDLLVRNIDNSECGMAELAAQDVLPQVWKKIAASLSDLAKQLTLIDRYEQQALSRRKFAVRDFDLARRQAKRRLADKDQEEAGR
jgi:hypothetical protein